MLLINFYKIINFLLVNILSDLSLERYLIIIIKYNVERGISP